MDTVSLSSQASSRVRRMHAASVRPSSPTASTAPSECASTAWVWGDDAMEMTPTARSPAQLAPVRSRAATPSSASPRRRLPSLPGSHKKTPTADMTGIGREAPADNESHRSVPGTGVARPAVVLPGLLGDVDVDDYEGGVEYLAPVVHEGFDC